VEISLEKLSEAKSRLCGVNCLPRRPASP